MTQRGNLNQKAKRIIDEAGPEGIMQSELWKILGVSSREGSRLSLRFEQQGKVERRKILHGGRWSYKLVTMKENVTLNSVQICPCIVCEEMDKCFEGGSQDPVECKKLTDWIAPRKPE